jgi:integrase
MSKKTSAIIGVIFKVRPGKTCDAFRAWVFKEGKYSSISAKVHPTLRGINKYLKDKRLREPEANTDVEFIKLKQRLEQELRSEFGLATYKAIERLDMQTKNFDFEKSLGEFATWKSRTSVSHSYRRTMEIFWLPFFLKEKNCIHPSEFVDHKEDAELHVRGHLTPQGLPISFHSYNNYFKALNQYMEFCLAKKILGPDAHFKLWHIPTTEEMKRGQLKRKRSTTTYDFDEIQAIKERIDKTYAAKPDKKLEAYGFLFGVMSGLRRGNILGLKADDLFPDHEVPHFRVSDNIVPGYSRGLKGPQTFENATKTTTQEDEEVILPLLQPSVEIASEVTRYLKSRYRPTERICPSTPGGFYRVWKRISKECGFRFLHPHGWKHSYATNGAAYLESLYKGDPRLLQLCCLHSSFKMTEKYIKKKYPKSLMAWAPSKA